MQRDLTVVIASRNRRELLRRCLTALAHQTQDPDTFEVIVADDGSSDGTAGMVEGLPTPLHVRVLQLQQGGWAAAQNAAIHASEGAVCLITDDDVIASPALVAEHVSAHGSGGQLIGIGVLTQQPRAARDWYAHAFARAWNEHYDELDHRPARWTDCYGGNLSAPRSTLIEVGGFATDLSAAEDIELGYRLCAAGCVPRYIPNARAVHDDQKRGSRMIEDAQRHAVSYLEVAKRHPAALPDMLGRFRATGDRLVSLRRLLITLRAPPTPLASIGGLIPGNGRKMVWFHFVSKLAFWRSIRQSVSRHRWTQLASDTPARQEDVPIAQSTQ